MTLMGYTIGRHSNNDINRLYNRKTVIMTLIGYTTGRHSNNDINGLYNRKTQS